MKPLRKSFVFPENGFAYIYAGNKHACMIHFTAVILQFEKQGEKTGWSYVSIPPDIAEELKPGYKKSFRVKGRLDTLRISQMALLPMGEGAFILPLKASVRKSIHKNKGATVKLSLEEDKKPLKIFSELTECLKDYPGEEKKFNAMLHAHQMYYSHWIASGKTIQTRAKRIMATILGMERNLSFSEVLKLNAQTVNK